MRPMAGKECCAPVAGKEFGDSLGAQVVKILTSSASKPLLKKKAALCLLRMCVRCALRVCVWVGGGGGGWGWCVCVCVCECVCVCV